MGGASECIKSYSEALFNLFLQKEKRERITGEYLENILDDMLMRLEK